MPSFRYHGPEEGNGTEPEVLPFPQPEPVSEPETEETVSEVMDALESVSRRMAGPKPGPTRSAQIGTNRGLLCAAEAHPPPSRPPKADLLPQFLTFSDVKGQ